MVCSVVAVLAGEAVEGPAAALAVLVLVSVDHRPGAALAWAGHPVVADGFAVGAAAGLA